MTAPTTPRATYRFQFHKDFTFADAEALVPYLDELGISHLYASPITTARSGSTHGYDVVDPTRINPELGGEDAFEALSPLFARETWASSSTSFRTTWALPEVRTRGGTTF
ncbi:alpha-amylase family glycosyl hydrolase [Sphingomonas sp. 22L2VL55-3]